MDIELTNYKNGIDVIWGTGNGADKGSAYYEEYYYYDKLINDTKTVYIKDTTPITMSHNERNMGAVTPGVRTRYLIGAKGRDNLDPITYTGISHSISNTGWLYLPGHTFSSGNPLRYVSGSGFNVVGNSGLITGNIYYVRDLSGDYFQLTTFYAFAGPDAPRNITTDGLNGVFHFNDEGEIRYVVDKYWNSQRKWATTTGRHPLYTGSFSLSSLEYESGVPVVGTVSGNIPGITQASFYWRGLNDAYGDEWHVLRYADDDSLLPGMDDGRASEGKYVLLVVNPKTPCITFRGISGGQFYTTPAWTYYVPKIHNQITYISELTGQVSIELKDIYQNPIIYRINTGNWQTGSSSVTLFHSNFESGHNVLDYYYSGNQSYTKSRTIIRNPTFPSDGEEHGNRMWGLEYWNNFLNRSGEIPYRTELNRMNSTNGRDYSEWETYRRSGIRFGYTNWEFQEGGSYEDAFLAKCFGFTKRLPGALRTYAEYAKEKLLETHLNQHPVGCEANYWASEPIPCADLYYRGYWDAYFARNAAIAYDILISEYKYPLYSGGITPVEDYFIRDRLADWVHQTTVYLGGFFQPGDAGMWPVARNVGSTMITVVMPNYSTPYFGTCGLDGNTSVYQYAPFKTYNYTWKDYYLTHSYDYTATGRDGPKIHFGLEGPNTTDALLCDPGPPVPDTPTETATWTDRLAYTSNSQMGQWIYRYSNIVKMYDPGSSHAPLDRYLNELTIGTLYGAKKVSSEPNYGPKRGNPINVLNTRHPIPAANATLWVQSLPSNSGDSDDDSMQFNLLGLMEYDYQYYGSGNNSDNPIRLHNKRFTNTRIDGVPYLVWGWK